MLKGKAEMEDMLIDEFFEKLISEHFHNSLFKHCGRKIITSLPNLDESSLNQLVKESTFLYAFWLS